MMKNVLTVPFLLPLVPLAAAAALTFGPTGAPVAKATPTVREVVNPNEPMVVVPGLEFLGASRISTVEHCSELEGVEDWQNVITDEQLLNLEACLIEHT